MAPILFLNSGKKRDVGSNKLKWDVLPGPTRHIVNLTTLLQFVDSDYTMKWLPLEDSSTSAAFNRSEPSNDRMTVFYVRVVVQSCQFNDLMIWEIVRIISGQDRFAIMAENLLEFHLYVIQSLHIHLNDEFNILPQFLTWLGLASLPWWNLFSFKRNLDAL
jgi:hypothetical protein